MDRRPFLSFLLLVFLSNAVGSYFNIAYNRELIVRRSLTPAQVDAFWRVLVPAYNLAAYPLALGLVLLLLRPLRRAWRRLRQGLPVPPAELESCRRLLVDLPAYQVCLNLLAWLPGAVVFPLGIGLLAGRENAGALWLHFGVSFTVSALLTTMQTFFVLEAFLIEVLYPRFFDGARPAEVRGTVRVPLGLRVILLWASVAVVPSLALLAVALHQAVGNAGGVPGARELALEVFLVGLPSSGFLMWMMGRNLLTWVRAHRGATEAIARGDYAVRIAEHRPDEWGLLTDRFNDMARELERGEHLRETFGQFVSPEVRDEVLDLPELGGQLMAVTVLFADIRGFTRRTAGSPPRDAVDLLNRFFSAAVAAVEENGGWVNKFLGDGIMALFGAPRPRRDHPDLALEAAWDFLRRLEGVNREIESRGGERLQVGIGVHTGLALVGCVGAAGLDPNGRRRVRREFTAIGEAVNVAQRIEQLTKDLPGPILLSEETRSRLVRPHALESLGPRPLPGYAEAVVIHRVVRLERSSPCS